MLFFHKKYKKLYFLELREYKVYTDSRYCMYLDHVFRKIKIAFLETSKGYNKKY